MNEPIIKIRDMVKTYETPGGAIPVLRGIELDISEGEMVAIMGPSGSGKSTLLFILGLLQPATSGSYLIDGTEVLTMNRHKQAMLRRRFLGFVFQNSHLLDHTTVYENIEFPLIYSKVARSGRKDMIQQALAEVNLSNRIHHPTNRLSGGEQQRVAIARAFVSRPKVILCDEPTGQLDRQNSQQVMNYFRTITQKQGAALIIVTHDPGVAAQCDQTYSLDDGYLVQGDICHPHPVA